MRLWHYNLIDCLPKSQLLAQWRELNSIYVNQPNHILINYIYKYPKSYLYCYSTLVINEMRKRGYKISDKSYNNFTTYFADMEKQETYQMFMQHNNTYFGICYCNLLEKFIRGQKDFDCDTMKKIEKRYKEMMDNDI